MTATHVRATGALGDIVEFDVDFEAGKIIGTPIGEDVGLAIGGMDVYQGEIHFPQQQSFAMPHPLTDPQSMAWYLMSGDTRPSKASWPSTRRQNSTRSRRGRSPRGRA